MYDDLTRPPLHGEPLRRALAASGWRVEVVDRVDSTNVEVSRRARAGEAGGLVVVAEEQSAGRGRLARSWVSPPRSGLTFSVLLRALGPAASWGWYGLHAGVAVAAALRAHAGVDAVLKWPNDVLIDGRKVCGVLAEVVGPDAVVLGVGVNVTTRREELPGDSATSLVLAGATSTDRDPLLRAILRSLSVVLAAADRDAYRALCSTVGERVRVELPTGAVEGRAERVDDDGRLVVEGIPYGVGDVVHLRPAGGG